MARAPFHLRPGALLLEALLGIAVFALFLSAGGLILLLGQETTIQGGDRVRALGFAEEALEAVRAIRDSDYDGIFVGTYGVKIGPSGQWQFNGASVSQSGGYTTSVTITASGSTWAFVTARTTWKHGINRSGSVVLRAELTDWRTVQDIGNWSSVSVEGSYVDSGTPLFNDVAVSGNYAFVTSETSNGGDGLYVFDITNLASPQRVASSFDLGAPGYEVIVNDSTLYVLAGDTNSEVRAYDISSPSTLSSTNLLASYNLPGQAAGISLAIDGDTLYVGAIENGAAQRDEFYAFDIDPPNQIVLRGSLDDTSTNNAIALSGTAAYLGSNADISEIRVVSVENPDVPALDPAVGYNLTDVYDGFAVAVAGTSAILGRANGAAIEELILFDVTKRPVPLPPPGPWYREMGGSVNGLDTDVLACYAWAATDNASKELQIVSLHDKNLPEAASYNATSGDGRGLEYDETRDRVFLLTNKGFLILKPGSGSGPCA